MKKRKQLFELHYLHLQDIPLKKFLPTQNDRNTLRKYLKMSIVEILQQNLACYKDETVPTPKHPYSNQASYKSHTVSIVFSLYHILVFIGQNTANVYIAVLFIQTTDK